MASGTHVISTGADGRLLAADGAFARPGDLRDLTAIVAEALRHDRIVLHVHGGLVDARSGLAGAQRLTPVYTDAGAYPLFFVWRSGAVETIRNNVLEIAREEVFDRLVRRVLSWAVGATRDAGGGARGVGAARPSPAELDEELLARRRTSQPGQGREPFPGSIAAGTAVRGLDAADEAAFLGDVESDPELRRELTAVLAGRGRLGPERAGARGGAAGAATGSSRMDDAVLAELAVDRPVGGRDPFGMALLARKALQVLRAVLHRYRTQTDSGVYPTVVEELLRAFYLGELGGALWSTMKRDTLDAFGPGEDRAARLVLEQISGALASGASRSRVTLVGHSTGAVFIDNLLTAASRVWPVTAPVQVCLLAPACTTERFAAMLDSAEKLIGRFRMFTMTDEAEQADRLVGAVYPRSLLYLVSGLLERDREQSSVAPVLGLARYLGPGLDRLLASDLGRDARLDTVRAFCAAPGRVVPSPTVGAPVDGASSTARDHGAFDGDPAVLASLQSLIRSL